MSAKNRRKGSIFPGCIRGVIMAGAGVLILLAGTGCKDPTAKPPPPPSSPPKSPFKGRIQVPLPVDRVLIDTQGRKLDCQIIGKNPTTLTVIRKLDGLRLPVQIETLSAADQDFVAGLYDQAPPAIETNEDEDTGDPRIAGIIKKIERLEEDRFTIETKMSDPILRSVGKGSGKAGPRMRGMMTELKKIESELIQLNLDLRELRRKEKKS